MIGLNPDEKTVALMLQVHAWLRAPACQSVCVCARARVRACVRAYVRVCACVRVRVHESLPRAARLREPVGATDRLPLS